MIIVTDKYAISSDSRQWILNRNTAPNKPEASWAGFKFYGSLQALVSALREILLRESDYTNFADLERNLREINRLLDKKLKAMA